MSPLSSLPAHAHRVLRFLRSQLLVTPPLPTTPWTGKVAIVTGGNRGLGLECARHLVRLGASRVVLGVRDTQAGAAARAAIEAGTGRRGAVDVWGLDLASPASVEAFAARASAALGRVDAVVQNAGIATPRFSPAAGGREATIAVNVVGPVHLALLLLPKLRQTARAHCGATPHVVFVNSDVIFYTSFPERRAVRIFEGLDDRATARMLARYSVSKLMAAMCVRELVARAGGQDPVVVNYVNPGLCHSDILREASWPGYILKLPLARSTEVGSRMLASAASSGSVSRGRYLSDGGWKMGHLF